MKDIFVRGDTFRKGVTSYQYNDLPDESFRPQKDKRHDRKTQLLPSNS